MSLLVILEAFAKPWEQAVLHHRDPLEPLKKTPFLSKMQAVAPPEKTIHYNSNQANRYFQMTSLHKKLTPTPSFVHLLVNICLATQVFEV